MLLLVAAGAITHYGSAAFAAGDDPRIVVDELLAFPVATAIVLDDVIANLYTLLLLAGAREWLRRRAGP